MKRLALILAVVLWLAVSASAANPITVENAKTGTTAWQLTSPALLREIEGYFDLTSVNRGGTINLCVSTASAQYTVNIYRVGDYAGLGGRLVSGPTTRSGTPQTMSSTDAFGTRTLGCTDPYAVNVPSDASDWTTGIYLAKLTETTGSKQSYAIFVVRNDSSTSAFLYQQPVNTYQAYNQWGGKSSYLPAEPNNAVKVSFNRPYVLNPSETRAQTGVGAGDFLTNIASTNSYGQGGEINFVRFVEKEGYDFSYSTNVDTHTSGNLILNHRAFISAGHDEYQTKEARDNVEAARAAGVHIAFFGHNSFYEQVRYESSNRLMVAYRTRFAEDPTQSTLTATQFRNATYANRPEETLVGMSYILSPVNADIVITTAGAAHWIFAGSGFSNGTTLTGLLGNEIEAVTGSSPAGIVTLAHSPASATFGDMTVYQHASGAWIFNAGSSQFNWGLDDYNSAGWPSTGRPPLVSAGIQQATRNILNLFQGAQSPQCRFCTGSARGQVRIR